MGPGYKIESKYKRTFAAECAKRMAELGIDGYTMVEEKGLWGRVLVVGSYVEVLTDPPEDFFDALIGLSLMKLDPRQALPAELVSKEMGALGITDRHPLFLVAEGLEGFLFEDVPLALAKLSSDYKELFNMIDRVYEYDFFKYRKLMDGEF